MHAEDLTLERAEDLDAAREGWDALAVAAGNPFATPDWVAAWSAVYDGGRPAEVWLVRDGGGRLAAVLPLVRIRRGPLVLVRFAGHGAADRLGPVCAPADRPLAARALRQVAAGLPRHALLLAERLPGGDGIAAAGRPLRHESSPVLEIAGDWDGWLAAKSSNFRGQVRRMERRLAREHELRFRLSDDPARLADDLETLFRLHDARWAEEGGTDAFDADRRALHHDVAARMLAAGRLRLWIAEVDGAPAAAWYGFRIGGRDWYYQMGRDPSYDRFKVGFVLLVHTIRDAFAAGMTAYEFGLGPEEYKGRFATADPGLDTVLLGRRHPVALAAAGADAVQRMPAGLRRAVVAGAG